MSGISTMKLSRISLKSLEALQHDPKAVSNSIDAYQGKIQADRTVGNNLRDQATALTNFFDDLSTGVKAAHKGYKSNEEEAGFKAWQNASPEQKEIYKTMVKDGSISAGMSPYFNNVVESGVAAMHATEYNMGFNKSAFESRTAKVIDKRFLNANGEWDLLQFSRHHQDDYQKENGLLNVSSGAYQEFAKGIEATHAGAFRRYVETQDVIQRKQATVAFGAKVLNKTAVLSGGEFVKWYTDHFKKTVTDIGLDPTNYAAQTQATIEDEYIKQVLSGDKDAETLLETYGEIPNGTGQLLKNTPIHQIWKRELHAKADRQLNNRLNAIDNERKLEVAKFGEKFKSRFDEFDGKNADFFGTSDAAHFLTWAKKYSNSSDPDTASLAKQILATRYGGIPDVIIDNMTYELHKLPKEQGLAEFMSYNPTIAQLNEFKAQQQSYRQIKTGLSGLEFLTLVDKHIKHTQEHNKDYDGTAVPNNMNEVTQAIRVGWHIPLADAREKALTAAINDVDKSLTPQAQRDALRTVVGELNRKYDEGMEAKFQEYKSRKHAELEQAGKDKAVTRERSEYIETLDVAEWKRGDKNIDDHQRLLKDAKVSAPSNPYDVPKEFHVRALINADKALMRSTRFKQAAESLGLKPILENIRAISAQMRLITSDIYGPNGAPKTEDITDEQKKEIQETILQGLQGWVTNTKDSLLNLTPEFIEEGVNDGLDGVQSILESLPETASGLVDSLKGTLGDVGLPGFDATTKAALEEGAEEVVSAVTDALLGKEAVAADTPESNTGASDSQLTTTEKIALDKRAKQAEAAQSNDKAFMDDLLGVKPSEEPVKPEDVIPKEEPVKPEDVIPKEEPRSSLPLNMVYEDYGTGKKMVWTDTIMRPAQKAAKDAYDEGEFSADGNGGVNTKKAFDKHFGAGKFAEVKAEQRKQFALQTKRLSEHSASSIGKHIKPEWIQNMWMHETKKGTSILANTYNLGNIKKSKAWKGETQKFRVWEMLDKAGIARARADKSISDKQEFKIPANPIAGKKYKVYVHDAFKKYGDFKEAAADFVKLLNTSNYAKVREAKTQREFVQALADRGYFTHNVEKYLAGLKANESKVKRG